MRADEFSVDEGETTFSDGRHSLDLRWRGDNLPDATFETLARGTRDHGSVDVDGHVARVYGGSGAEHDSMVLWSSDGYALELRTDFAGDFLDEEGFQRVLASLKDVDVDTWLAAMPATVVLPDARLATVREMLDGIPLPDAFEREPLSAGDAVKDRYQLGAAVTGAVACAWIRQWVRGDARARREAVTAMGTSRRWPILLAMRDQGDWSEVVWEYADALAGDGTVLGGKVLTVEESYGAALGCG